MPHSRPLDVGVVEVLRSPRLLTREVLAGVVTTLALVPEVISFSVIAGVDPRVSLVASVALLAITTVLGGRPAMVTAAAGSVALVIAPLVHAHGAGYVLPAVLLGGVVQVLFGVLGLARLMRFVPRSVMLGFVNALGVLIFAAQVPHLLSVPWAVYPLFVLTLVVVLLLPRLTTAVPAALVAIVLVTAIAVVGGLHVPTVGDEGRVSGALPGITAFTVPLNAATLAVVWPTALSVAFVGLLESLLTAKLVDRITDTPSRKNRESWGLGVANIGAGLWGGIGGCAMIGQTLVNVKAGGGRTRVSTGVAAVFLLALLTALGPVLAVIPMVALAAVMMVVAVTTIDRHSLRPATLRRMPLPETGVMALTVARGAADEQPRARRRCGRAARDGAVRPPGRARDAGGPRGGGGRRALHRPGSAVLRQQQRPRRSLLGRRRPGSGGRRPHARPGVGRVDGRCARRDRAAVPRPRPAGPVRGPRRAQHRLPCPAHRPSRRLNSRAVSGLVVQD